MKISPTLSAYLARRYVMNMLFMLGCMLALIYIFDAVEVIRRASKTADVTTLLALEMALLKLPKEGQALFPFAILYSAMFTCWQLTRRYELIVVRAAGFSFWQFLAPIIGVAALMGFVQMGIVNPVSSILVSKYEQMEAKYLTHGDSAEIALFREGLWLRQSTDEGYLILYSPKVEQKVWVLDTPMALFFDKDDQLERRIDAASARLEKEKWVFQNVTMEDGDKSSQQDQYVLPTKLTRTDVEDSFSSPASMSFWRLPAHIRTMEQTGFDSSKLRVYYQSLLAEPLLFAAMILLGAAVSLRPPRQSGGTLTLLMAGVFIGFVVFFTSSFLQALGSTQQIPVILAAWSPAFISLLFGLGAMMSLEDG